MSRPVLVAGGGLAGAAAACVLARAGREVAVFEREAAATDKICGEFVSAEAQAYLQRLGIDLAGLGAAPIHRLRLVRGRSVVGCALPFAGWGLSRRVLDEALLRQAEADGAQIRRGHAVALRRDRGPIVLDVAGQEIAADTLFLATGKQDLRGLRRMADPTALVGFKLHLGLAPAQLAALRGHVEILLLRDGYAGLQCIENASANLCLLVEPARLQRAGGWEGLLADLQRTEPHLRQRLAGATGLADRPLAISRVPYGFVHAPGAADPPGVFRLGDQMGVIPSFTGDGMSIALHSARLAVSCHLAGLPAAEYHRRMRADIASQIAHAGRLYRLGRSAPGLLMRLAATWPGLLRLAARLTRVPDAAVARGLA